MCLTLSPEFLTWAHEGLDEEGLDDEEILVAFLDALGQTNICPICSEPYERLGEDEGARLLQVVNGLTVRLPAWLVLELLTSFFQPYVGKLGRFCTCPPVRRGFPTTGFIVYRLWSKDDRLVYVGATTNLKSRLKAHRRRFGDVIENVSWEVHGSIKEMLEAEGKAIRDEDPVMNRAGIG